VDHEEVAAAIVLQESELPASTPGPGPTPDGGGPVVERRKRIDRQAPLAALARAARSDPARRRWETRSVRTEALARARGFTRAGGRLVLRSSAEFPPRLQPFPWCPPWLWVRGQRGFPAHAVAMVGTRKATPSACAFTAELAGGAAAAGVTVASGLALGIDGAAHRGALAAGGRSLAVLGTGVDRCYPAAHRRLYFELLERGLAVSELPPGALPMPHHFPRRNRLLAALCRAVVVVQAPLKSGALITAGHAGEIGAELLAVPGDPMLPENAGSNWLLTVGFRPALGVDDVVSAVLGHEVAVPALPGAEGPAAVSAAMSPGEEALLGALDFVPRAVEAVAIELGRPIGELLSLLLGLELRGLVEPQPGGAVRLTPKAAPIAARVRRPRAAGRSPRSPHAPETPA
jgi:DNA processing protein